MWSAAPPLVLTILRRLATTASPPHALSRRASCTLLLLILHSHSCPLKTSSLKLNTTRSVIRSRIFYTHMTYDEFILHSRKRSQGFEEGCCIYTNELNYQSRKWHLSRISMTLMFQEHHFISFFFPQACPRKSAHASFLLPLILQFLIFLLHQCCLIFQHDWVDIAMCA